MKTELRKVYECEYCGRRMLSAGAMARHEKGCSQNPINHHACFRRCIHLKKTIEHTWNDDMPCDITHFACEKTGHEMYSYKFEKAAGFKPAYTLGLIRMPLSCRFYEAEDGYVHPFSD